MSAPSLVRFAAAAINGVFVNPKLTFFEDLKSTSAPLSSSIRAIETEQVVDATAFNARLK
ncbi:hypothetical protein N7467_011251 [Penicillium canescens]|nr:hypothetical protein N7467_011251 [Penicillium canescens]